MSRRLMAILVALFTAVGVVALTSPASAATATTTASTFTYTGTWGSLSSGEYYSNQTNATATSFFTVSTGGGTVSLRGVKHTGQGIEAISVDGGAEVSVNMYATSQQPAAVIYTSPTLAAGNHSIRARVTGTKDSRSSGLYASNTGAQLSNGVFRTNAAPVVNAGADKSVTMPNAVTLAGSVTDDGIPAPMTASWSQVSGPGTTTFANPAAASTTAIFSVDGTYTLRLTGSDTALTRTDDVVVVVSPAPVNTAPVVNAGADQTVTLPSGVTLSGSVSDDGIPGPATAAWSTVSGPGTVTFANASSASTTATFSVDGAYVLRLTGNDGALSSSDDVAVTVNAEVTVAPEPTQPPASGVTLNRDFDTCDASQWVGSSGLEAASPAHQFAAVSSPMRQDGGCSGRFEIHNNTSDYLNGGGYRSLYGQYDSNEGTTGGTDFVYGFSFLMPQLPNGTQLWELHQRRNIYAVDPDIAIAPHAIVVRNGQIQYREMTGAASWNGSSWTGWTNYQDQKVLDTAVANTWYDIMVRIKASEGSDGITQVWIRRAGQAWTTAPTWQNFGPSLPYVPGGLDPNVPTKRSIYEPESGTGLTGLYLEAGIYNPGSTYSAGVSPFVTYYDNLRRYTDVASAKTGFPA